MAKTKEKQQNLRTFAMNTIPKITAGVEVAGIRTVPVVMMVPGVHNGSHGPILHTEEGLIACAEAWQDKPIVIKHPQDTAGNFISANSEGVVHIGRLINCRFEDNALRADMILNEQALIACSPEAHKAIVEVLPTDVSIGAYTVEKVEEGTWNDEAYNAIATSYTPDHLAILPGEQGACSWKDGCGIRVNSEKPKTLQEFLQANVEQSLHQKLDAAYNAVNAMDTPTTSCWLDDVFEAYLIYRKNVKNQGNTISADDQPKYYRQAYTWQDGKVEFVGEPQEVLKEVQYRTITNNKNKEIKKMKEELIGKLIANKATNWTEEDRETLATFSECALKKMLPIEQATVQVNADNVSAYIKGMDVVEAIKLLPEGIQAKLTAYDAQIEAERNGLIDGILKGSDKVWEEAELKGLETNMLKKLAQSLNTDITDYSGGAGGAQPKSSNNLPEALPFGA